MEEKKEFGFDEQTRRETDGMTPAAYFAWLFGRTDAKGQLTVPVWNNGKTIEIDRDCRHTCRMTWNENDRDRIAAEAETLLAALSEIAALYDRLSDSEEENAKILPPALLAVWRTYIRPFQTGDVDLELMRELEEDLEIVSAREDLETKRVLGTPLNENELRFLAENADITVDSGDAQYYDAYLCMIDTQCKERVGDKKTARELVMRAKRLCRLQSLKAPDMIVSAERKCLMQLMAMHAFGTEFGTIRSL